MKNKKKLNLFDKNVNVHTDHFKLRSSGAQDGTCSIKQHVKNSLIC